MKVQVVNVKGHAEVVEFGTADFTGSIEIKEVASGGRGGILRDKVDGVCHCFRGDGCYMGDINAVPDAWIDPAEQEP